LSIRQLLSLAILPTSDIVTAFDDLMESTFFTDNEEAGRRPNPSRRIYKETAEGIKDIVMDYTLIAQHWTIFVELDIS